MMKDEWRNDERAKRRLKVDWCELEFAFDSGGDLEMEHFLNLETGEVVTVTDEAQSEMERPSEELDEEDQNDAAFEALVQQSDSLNCKDEEVLAAWQVEAAPVGKFIKVPRLESHEGYADMEAFIETVGSRHLRDLLDVAIDGRLSPIQGRPGALSTRRGALVPVQRRPSARTHTRVARGGRHRGDLQER